MDGIPTASTKKACVKTNLQMHPNKIKHLFNRDAELGELRFINTDHVIMGLGHTRKLRDEEDDLV